MKAQYNKEYYPIICYFDENKRKYFAYGDYNYNTITEDILLIHLLERSLRTKKIYRY